MLCCFEPGAFVYCRCDSQIFLLFRAFSFVLSEFGDVKSVPVVCILTRLMPRTVPDSLLTCCIRVCERGSVMPVISVQWSDPFEERHVTPGVYRAHDLAILKVVTCIVKCRVTFFYRLAGISAQPGDLRRPAGRDILECLERCLSLATKRGIAEGSLQARESRRPL